jgi:hypothetical protein
MKKDDYLVDHYEEIRRVFYERHHAVIMWGLVVLRTKGMAAWARTWRQYGECGAGHISPLPPPRTTSHVPAKSEDLVRVLAEMVWAIHEEAAP